MNRMLKFRHITPKGYALLADKEGNTVSLLRTWLPKEAAPDQVVHAVCVSDEDVSSLFIELAHPWQAGDT